MQLLVVRSAVLFFYPMSLLNVLLFFYTCGSVSRSSFLMLHHQLRAASLPVVVAWCFLSRLETHLLAAVCPRDSGDHDEPAGSSSKLTLLRTSTNEVLLADFLLNKCARMILRRRRTGDKTINVRQGRGSDRHWNIKIRKCLLSLDKELQTGRSTGMGPGSEDDSADPLSCISTGCFLESVKMTELLDVSERTIQKDGEPKMEEVLLELIAARHGTDVPDRRTCYATWAAVFARFSLVPLDLACATARK